MLKSPRGEVCVVGRIGKKKRRSWLTGPGFPPVSHGRLLLQTKQMEAGFPQAVLQLRVMGGWCCHLPASTGPVASPTLPLQSWWQGSRQHRGSSLCWSLDGERPQEIRQIHAAKLPTKQIHKSNSKRSKWTLDGVTADSTNYQCNSHQCV